MDFKELLKTDPQAVKKLLTQADQDALNELCTKKTYEDGGTVEYRYRDYTVINFHALNEEGGYHEALVIHRGSVVYDELFAVIFKGLVYI